VGPPIAVLVFGERLSRLQTTGLLLGLLGLVVRSIRPAMDWSDSAGVQANLMLMGASFLWGMTILHLRYYKGDSAPTSWPPRQMLLATVPLLALAYAVEGRSPATAAGRCGIVLYVGPVATAFCLRGERSQHALSATRMSTAMLGVPLIGLLASTWFLGESLSLSLVLGGLGIVGGIAWSAWAHAARWRRSAPAGKATTLSQGQWPQNRGPLFSSRIFSP
jgi:drug/metabolite transporter (DMT)-like permease